MLLGLNFSAEGASSHRGSAVLGQPSGTIAVDRLAIVAVACSASSSSSAPLPLLSAFPLGILKNESDRDANQGF